MKHLSLIIALSILFVGIIQLGYTKTVHNPITYAKVTSYKKAQLGGTTFSLFEVDGMKCLYRQGKTLVNTVYTGGSGYGGGTAMYIPTEVLSCVPIK